MPIKGLSDRGRLPRVGKIRLGIKRDKGNDVTYPVAVDYFVVNEDENTPAAAARAFKEVYGNTPRELDIAFPPIPLPYLEAREQVFPQNYEQYGKGTGLKCRGDGVTALRLFVESGTGLATKREVQCLTPDHCQYVRKMGRGADAKPDCGASAHLLILLPKVQGIGVWQIDTGSVIGIQGVNSELNLLQLARGGSLQGPWLLGGIPLKLALRPVEVAPDGRKKTVHVLTIRYNGAIADLRRVPAQAGADVLPPPVPDDDIPTDHRPSGLLNDHTDAAPPLDDTADEPPPDTAAVLEDPEDAPPTFTAAQPIPDLTYKLDGPAPEPTDDPIYNGIVFHAWRAGVEPSTLAVTARLHKQLETLLAALQKTPTPLTRAQQLKAMGYRPDGLEDIPGRRKK